MCLELPVACEPGRLGHFLDDYLTTRFANAEIIFTVGVKWSDSGLQQHQPLFKVPSLSRQWVEVRTYGSPETLETALSSAEPRRKFNTWSRRFPPD